MLNRFLTYLKFGNHFCGIEHTSMDAENTIQSVILKKNKNEVDIEHQFKAESIEKLAKQLSKNQHAYLIVNDANILTKKVESTRENTLKTVRKAFPNIELDDFYYEVIQQKENSFVSIGRKEHIDRIVETYLEHNIHIINLSIGNSLIMSISNFIEIQSLQTSNAQIEMEEGGIKSINQSMDITIDIYNVNGIESKSNTLLSLCGALSSILNNYVSDSNLHAKKQMLTTDFNQSRFFSQFLKFGLVFILGLLLTNFFFFNHYFNKANTLEQTAQMNVTAKESVLKLNESVGKVEKMVEDVLNSQSSKSSFYTNVIMQDLPKSIVLEEYNYQPLSKRMKPKKPIELEKDIVTISGGSNNSEVFSEWINSLENKDWIDNVAISEYGSEITNSSEFSIKITLKNDE